MHSSSLRIQKFTFNPFAENTYLLFDGSLEAILIDPGCCTPAEERTLDGFIQEHQLKVVGLYNTHCHIDHVLGNAFAMRHYGVGLCIHALEVPYLKAVESYASNYGFTKYQASEARYFYNEGDQVKFGDQVLEVLFAPGHAPGHVLLHSPQASVCIVGDVIFKESIGRTDLPGGNFDTLMHSIRTKVFSLPRHTILHPGHGEATTVQHEQAHNPFCKTLSILS